MVQPNVNMFYNEQFIGLCNMLKTYLEMQELMSISEASGESEKAKNKSLTLEPLDVEAFVKDNDCKEITNPIHFIRDNMPSPDGLLSNEIFGTTMSQRANIFAYIDLHGWYIHPLIYKLWSRMDKRIKEIVHGTKRFTINSSGDFVEDEKGETGIDFLRKNFDKIRIKSTESKRRDKKIQYIEKYKKNIFMKKMVVIPAYYRDANTSGGKSGVGILNKYYAQLIINVRSITETQDYGIPMSNSICGRIQENIVQIYDCICGTSGAEVDGIGLSKKKGLVTSNVMSKTTDYGSRLIITSPELKVEKLEDMIVDIDHCAVPLSSICANFKPFVIFATKQFFENNFNGNIKMQFLDKEGKMVEDFVKDPLVQFSEEVISEEIKRFIYGYSNRLRPVTVKLESGKTCSMIFKGHIDVTPEEIKNKSIPGESPLVNRRLTWCDVFYMAATEAVKDKHVLVTRFPMDSAYNQQAMKVRISSLKETEKVLIDGIYYPWYPKIREKDIHTNTSNKFIDTLQISNLYLKGYGGDYDGDQMSVKGVYTVEANEELEEFMRSKVNLISISAKNIKISTNESVAAIYSMTKILAASEPKLTKKIKLG